MRWRSNGHGLLLALEIRGVAEEVRQNRTDDGSRRAVLSMESLLVHVINADLGGGGAAHHAGAELTNAAEDSRSSRRNDPCGLTGTSAKLDLGW